MIVKYNITPGQKLTEEERKEVRNAKKLKPQVDEDCPEISETMLKSLKKAVRPLCVRNKENQSIKP